MVPGRVGRRHGRCGSTRLKLVRTADRRIIASALPGIPAPLQFAADGKSLLVDEGIWTIPSLAPESEIAYPGSWPVLSPDGSLVATDRGIYARSTGELVGPPDLVSTPAPAFSPDGTVLALVDGFAVHLLRTSDWAELRTIKLLTDTRTRRRTGSSFRVTANIFFSRFRPGPPRTIR